MTRIDSVRAATDSAKDSVQHAAEVVAPYAETAKDQAAHYAHEAAYAARAEGVAGSPAGPCPVRRLSRTAYRTGPRSCAAQGRRGRAARPRVRTRKAARQAAEYTVPRVEHAVAAAQPVARGGHGPQHRGAGRAARAGHAEGDPASWSASTDGGPRPAASPRASPSVGLVAGGAFAAWKWWDKQANPDWLVEPPAATEVSDRAPLTSVDGSGPTVLDPEVQAKQDDAGPTRWTERTSTTAAEPPARQDGRREDPEVFRRPLRFHGGPSAEEKSVRKEAVRKLRTASSHPGMRRDPLTRPWRARSWCRRAAGR